MDLSLYAIGLQDDVMLDKNKSINPEFLQYSDFSIDQTRIPFGTPPYLGTFQSFEIPPKTISGDLLCNAFFKCTLPAIGSSNSYTDQVGRALFTSISIYFNEVEIETLDPDWYVIRDQLFLDEDEKTLMSNVINGNKNGDGTIDLYIPLDFFFCRRVSSIRDEKKKKFLPLCAIYNQKIYIKINFANMSDISSCGNTFDFVSAPEIILEHITLTDDQRRYFMQPSEIIINKVYREPFAYINNSVTNIGLTANFPVSLLVWFIKENLSVNNPLTYSKRFNYSYIKTTNLNLLTTDIFEYLKIFINNEDITDGLPGINFYKYLQPLYCGLSSPSKDIYMYSFGLKPNQYNQGGSLDFTKVDSSTSFLTFKILPDFLLDVILNYRLCLYYYGYNVLTFSDGYCSKKYI
jgi:hypothetical protein